MDPQLLEEVGTWAFTAEPWFRTPQLMQGYLNKPEATAEVITDNGLVPGR